ncbi:hypothetical protein [Tuwongella immobilis]|nr:hypothetical protein [Tuwongella immobilis]
MVRFMLGSVGLFLLLGLAGCDSGPKRPEVKPAEGKFTIKGKPYAGVILVFHPSDPAMKDVPMPRATTEADGSYKLTTFAAYDGGMPGEYKVVAMVESVMSPLMMKGSKPPAIPATYQKAETTTLTATIGTAEKNTLPDLNIP